MTGGGAFANEELVFWTAGAWIALIAPGRVEAHFFGIRAIQGYWLQGLE